MNLHFPVTESLDAGTASTDSVRSEIAEYTLIKGILIVGWSGTASGDPSAFVYDNNGPGYPVDLNNLIPTDSGWKLVRAAGINGSGQIAGSGDINGQHHAFLLTPR